MRPVGGGTKPLGRLRRRRRRARDRRAGPDPRAQRGRLHRGARGRRAAGGGAGGVRASRPDARARPAAGPGDARRSAGSSRPPTPARCATATAACATWWSASRSCSRDGTVAKSGGKVIKNVAGYDLGEAVHRLVRDARADRDGLGAAAPGAGGDRHRARRAATTRTRSPRAARRSRALPLEADCARRRLGGRRGPRAGALRRRHRGRAGARDRGADASSTAVEITEDDDELWDAQRARQRRRDGAVLKVSGRPTDLRDVIRAAERRRTVVSRAALGLSWLALRARRRPRRARRDARAGARAARLHGARRRAAGVEPTRGPTPTPARWSSWTASRRASTRRRIFRPGAFVGGI